MRLNMDMVVRAIFVLFALGVLWAAAAFGAFAIFALLHTAAGTAIAAALTAAILLLVIAVGILVYFALSRAPRNSAAVASVMPVTKPADQNVAAALAQLAREHPFVAVGCALLLGVADSIQAENHRIRGN